MPPSTHSETLSLSQFESKMELSGQDGTLLPYNIYRMDGDSENNIERMAKYADLGTPSCCDFLYTHNEKKVAILVEDTYLEKKTKNTKTQYQDLFEKNPSEYKKLFKQLILKENCLKVYGSLLILCYLKQKYNPVKELNSMNNKNILFWFVINDNGDVPAIDNMQLVPYLKEEFKKTLSGHLQGAKLVKAIEVLMKKEFPQKLKQL